MTSASAPLLTLSTVAQDFHASSSALFFGFVAGSILMGATILQASFYFINYFHDCRKRKITAIIVCMLDVSHFTFSTAMMYTSYTNVPYEHNGHLLLCLKAMAAVKIPLMFLVEGFYLCVIWTLAEQLLITVALSRSLKSFSIITSLYSLATAAIFLACLAKTLHISDFPASFERMIYIGFLSSASIDIFIALIISISLFRAMSEMKSHAVLTLVFFFIGTSVLTAVAAIITVVLYFMNKSSVLYLSIEFVTSRIYSNSILALFNSKEKLQQMMEGSHENDIFHAASHLVFGDVPERLDTPAPDHSANLLVSQTEP